MKDLTKIVCNKGGLFWTGGGLLVPIGLTRVLLNFQEYMDVSKPLYNEVSIFAKSRILGNCRV